MRSTVLARALADRGFAVVVASRAPSDHVRSFVGRAGFDLAEIRDEGEEEIAERVGRGASVAIIDGYTFDAGVHAAYARAGCVVAVVDDLADAPLHADVVVNGNLFAEELAGRYAGMAVGRALLGPAYALVREEFRAARESGASELAKGARPRVLVTMGGADPAGASELFLAALPSMPPMDVRLVVGGANPRAAEIRACATRVRSADHHVDVVVDPPRMSDEMARADLAVAAAGGTCLELATLGVPAIVLVVADNQRPVGAAVARLGMMVDLGPVRDLDPGALASAVGSLLSDPSRARALVRAQRASVDGRGALRAAAVLEEVVRGRLAKV